MMWGLATLAALPLAAAVADTTSGFDPVSLISSAGVAGAFAVAFAAGRIRSKAEVDNLRSDLAEARAQVIVLQTAMTQEVVPALVRSTEAVKNAAVALRRRAGDG